jgi:hypothetical protein
MIVCGYDCVYVYITVIIWIHCILLDKSVCHYVVEDRWLTRPHHEIVVLTTITCNILQEWREQLIGWLRKRPLVCIRIIYGYLLLVPSVARILSFLNVITVSERKVIILYWGYSVSSNVSLWRKKYILLPIFNSDDIIMSCGNRNFHLPFFVKNGALHQL